MLCQWLPSPSTTTRRLVLKNVPSLGLPALIRSPPTRAFPLSLRTTSLKSNILNYLNKVLVFWYSKHPHIRTLFSGLRLLVFLFEGCVVTNQPESVLKMFLRLFSEILQIYY